MDVASIRKKKSYGTKRQTERLIQENKKMEWNLQKLRSQIERDRAKTQAKAVKGDSIWKTAATRNGKLRSYGSHVREKCKSRPEGAEKRVLKGAEARSWTQTDVQAWVESIGLGKYKNAFRENEIDGEILLEIGVDDLDYMGITALGSRKNLLKQVARLKRCVDPNYRELAHESPQSSPNVAPMRATEIQYAQAPSPQQYVEESKHQGSDLRHGEIDEEAEHEAFRRAVEEWRNGRSACNEEKTRESSNQVCSSREVYANTDVRQSTTGGKLLSGEIDEESEHRAFSEAVNSWRRDKQSNSKVQAIDYETYKELNRERKEAIKEKLLKAYEENLKSSKPQTVRSPSIDMNMEGWDFEAAF